MEEMLISKYRKILTEDVLHVPGLKLFGYNISSKATFPMESHVHKDCFEFVLMIKGNESYSVDGKSFPLSGGDVFISFDNQPHRNGNEEQGICEILWFQINPYVKQNFLGLSKPMGEVLRHELLNLNNHVLKTDKEGITLLKRSFDSFLQFKPEQRLYAQSMLIGFLSRLLFAPKQYFKDDDSIATCIRYIDNNICNPITIDEICSIINVSLSSFKHKFKEVTGDTPRNYINRRKVQMAKELLKSGKNVMETAMHLSFSSSDYFSVVFKKYTNRTPTEYILDCRDANKC